MSSGPCHGLATLPHMLTLRCLWLARGPATCCSYKQATVIAQRTLVATDPLRLGLALNYAVRATGVPARTDAR